MASQLDESGFRDAVAEHRAELHAHCYRMLGSYHDAEDALQDTLLHAWRGLPGFAGRSSLRTWLYRIATNACLDEIARRPKRAPLIETAWVEPYPSEVLGVPEDFACPRACYEQREAVELAFVAALLYLPARQRAVLILREVFGFSAREVSATLGTSVAAVNSSLQRAHKSLERRLPERSRQQALRLLGNGRVKELADALVDAWMRQDLDALRAVLAADVAFSLPPRATWWRGRDVVFARFRLPAELAA